MHKMPAGPSAYFDVDDTLIVWKDELGKEFKLPQVEVLCRGLTEVFYYNPYNLDYLRKLSVRGHAIVVWSAGGSDWAEAVVKALNVEHFVCFVASKPTYFIDDVTDPRKFMGRYEFYDIDGQRMKQNEVAEVNK